MLFSTLTVTGEELSWVCISEFTGQMQLTNKGEWRKLFLFLLGAVNLNLERLRVLKYSLKAYEHSNYITYRKGTF